jgi:hypothetical protein
MAFCDTSVVAALWVVQLHNKNKQEEYHSFTTPIEKRLTPGKFYILEKNTTVQDEIPCVWYISMLNSSSLQT